MHSKVAVIDSHWATVGSSNIDPISLWLAREANVVVDDAEFAKQLRGDIEQAMCNDARPVRLEDWNSAGRVRHFAVRLTYSLVRLLMGVVGFPDKA
jgi:cardiolipin synthase